MSKQYTPSSNHPKRISNKIVNKYHVVLKLLREIMREVKDTEVLENKLNRINPELLDEAHDRATDSRRRIRYILEERIITKKFAVPSADS